MVLLTSNYFHVLYVLYNESCSTIFINFNGICIDALFSVLDKTNTFFSRQQAAKPPDLNPETEESIPSRSSPEGPDPPVLTEVSKQEEQQPLDLEGVKRKMDQGNYISVVCFNSILPKF